MTDSIWSREFWKTILELAIRGAALGVGLAVGDAGFNAWQADWVRISGYAVGGAVISIAMSLGLTKVGQKDSPLVTAKPAGK